MKTEERYVENMYGNVDFYSVVSVYCKSICGRLPNSEFNVVLKLLPTCEVWKRDRSTPGYWDSGPGEQGWALRLRAQCIVIYVKTLL